MYYSKLVSSLNAIAALHAGSSIASPLDARSSYSVKERHAPPRAWANIGPASETETVNLKIGLKQSNEGTIEQHLLQVSDPSHSRYGQHLSADEVHDIVRPSDETLRLVSDWLASNDVTDFSHSPSKDWISVTLPLKKVEGLLQTKYYLFEHSRDGTTVARAPEWSLPLHLHDHIDVVQPTTSFFRPTPHASLEKRGGHVVLDSSAEHEVSWWEREGKDLYTSTVSLPVLACYVAAPPSTSRLHFLGCRCFNVLQNGKIRTFC
jgi:tripeptidyl-peptidase-1